MKVAVIATYPPKDQKHSKAGGVAAYTKNLTENLSLDETDKLYILCDKRSNHKAIYKEENREIIRCFNKDIRYMYQVVRELIRINPDVIHVQQEIWLFGNILTAYMLQWLVFLFKNKCIITIHGVVDLKKINKNFVKENNSSLPVWLIKLALSVLFRPLAKWAKLVIVHESYFKDMLINQYNVPAHKIYVIPIGIETLQRIPKMRARKLLGFQNNIHIILFMGYVAGYKNVDLLIEGSAEYMKKDKNAYLIIGAGKHPKLATNSYYVENIYKRLQQKAEFMLPRTRYQWIGFIGENEIPLYLSAADVMVYPYSMAMSASGPMALSIAYSVPILVSDAFKYLLDDDSRIFQMNVKDLGKCLSLFFESPKSIRKIKQLKRERSWQIVGKNTLSLYKETIL